MPSFTDSEFAYLNSKHRLGRVATVGPDGTPCGARGVELQRRAPLHRLAGSSKRRSIEKSSAAGEPPSSSMTSTVWTRGDPAASKSGVTPGRDDPISMIRIYPDRVVSWGLTVGGAPLAGMDESQAV
jgi:hypothetical protein